MGGEWTEIQRGLKQRMQHMEAGLIGFVAFLSAALLSAFANQVRQEPLRNPAHRKKAYSPFVAAVSTRALIA